MRSKVAKAKPIPARDSAAAKTSSHAERAAGLEFGWQWLALACLAAVLAFQPLAADDLWWQLARGRQVASGEIAPSRSLLTQETLAEADWLGGLPAYVVYQFAGGHGLMLFRVLMVAGGLAWLVSLRRSGGVVHPLVWIVTAAVLVTPAGRFDLMPAMFDVVALAVLVALMHRKTDEDSEGQVAGNTRRRSAASMVTAAGLFVIWSNLSPAILAGLIAWVTFSVGASLVADPHRRKNWILAGLMLAGGCINPRGVFAWSDSLSAIVPAWRNHPALLADTAWQPLIAAVQNQEAIVFFLITAIWIANQTIARARLPRGLFCFAWMQWLAWTSLHNVALATTWMAFDVLWSWHRRGRWTILDVDHARRKRMGALAVPIVLAMMLLFSGWLPTLGWGIDALLDSRMLRRALASTHPYGTAFADDTRSGGMLAWELPQINELSGADAAAGLRLQDVAPRAVIAGRFSTHQQIIDDLRQQRLMSYWRSDGSRGGYWVPLEHRETTLLVVSNRDTELIRGLEPSIWKPLSLDSPAIPYAAAGDEPYARQMIDTLTSREIVEFQNWQYSFPNSTGSLFDRDRWGIIPVIVDVDQAYRQAEVFRAMGLRYAALRVLFVARQAFPTSTPLAHSMTRCQTELAEAEIVTAGVLSWFRYFAAIENLADEQDVSPMQLKFAAKNPSRRPLWDAPPENRIAAELRNRVAGYLQRGPAALMVATDFQTDAGIEHAQLMYAGLCAAIEAGQHETADRYLQWFDDNQVSAEVKRLVEVRNGELHPSQTTSDEDS
ncbi:hypothetical protein [Novipirellula caenicola]|uniref:Glycosyltransferase RgtA/B/C/D-like domain-containing protein n=1 Tax=Novipirellula caenicola TaxID=1536901 RepID=A0ABP9VQN2_9BACT